MINKIEPFVELPLEMHSQSDQLIQLIASYLSIESHGIDMKSFPVALRLLTGLQHYIEHQDLALLAKDLRIDQSLVKQIQEENHGKQ